MWFEQQENTGAGSRWKKEGKQIRDVLGRGQIMKGLTDCNEDFGFYSVVNGEPLQAFEQRNDPV